MRWPAMGHPQRRMSVSRRCWPGPLCRVVQQRSLATLKQGKLFKWPLKWSRACLRFSLLHWEPLLRVRHTRATPTTIVPRSKNCADRGESVATYGPQRRYYDVSAFLSRSQCAQQASTTLNIALASRCAQCVFTAINRIASRSSNAFTVSLHSSNAHRVLTARQPRSGGILEKSKKDEWSSMRRPRFHLDQHF